jgi:hypothetical protein
MSTSSSATDMLNALLRNAGRIGNGNEVATARSALSTFDAINGAKSGQGKAPAPVAWRFTFVRDDFGNIVEAFADPIDPDAP